MISLHDINVPPPGERRSMVGGRLPNTACATNTCRGLMLHTGFKVEAASETVMHLAAAFLHMTGSRVSNNS